MTKPPSIGPKRRALKSKRYSQKSEVGSPGMVRARSHERAARDGSGGSHSSSLLPDMAVLKMLAVMSSKDGSPTDSVTDFLKTGRVGRRNALPDITSDHAMVTTADLPEKMDQLTTEDKSDKTEEKHKPCDPSQPGPSRSSPGASS